MTSYPKAKLCKLCENALSNHWAAKESIEPPKVMVQGDDTAEEEGVSDDDGEESHSSDFYEAPDWVVTLPEGEDAPCGSKNYRSPPHHSIAALEESSTNGCYLCAIFWDKVRHGMQQFTEGSGEVLHRLSSFVIARPARRADFEGGIIDLELAFFVDGIIRPDAHLMTVGIFIYELSDEIVTEEAFQPPIYHEEDEDTLLRSLSRIKEWISSCDNHHDGCKQEAQARHGPSNPRRLPTRLLRLKAGPDGPTVAMCNTQGSSQDTTYASLSHCWGKSQPLRLLHANYAQFSLNIDFASLPRTFQHAISLSLALGIDHIWIDSLCIIQDSHEDWLQEAASMCAVYSDSYLNIAATSSRDGTGGLFHKSALVRNCLIKPTWTGLPRGLYMCVDDSTWRRRIEEAPLNLRGWVLQDRMLSPRTVHCAYDQMWWTCRDAPYCCETFPTGALVPSWADESLEEKSDSAEGVEADSKPEGDQEANVATQEYAPLKMSTISLHTSQASLASLLDHSKSIMAWNESWLAIVRAYTSTQLTYGSDKLIAIAGIAQEARRARSLSEDDYVAGLWKADLPVGLLWRMAASGKREKKPCRAPSWSWASVDGEVYFHSPDKRLEARENLVAQILESHVVTTHGWSGPVHAGWLKIGGPILDITLSDAVTSGTYEPFIQQLRIGNEQFVSGESFGEVLDDDRLYQNWPKTGRQLYYACLKLSSPPEDNSGEYESEGLILERATDRSDGYCRIGWLRVDVKASLAMECRQNGKSYILW